MRAGELSLYYCLFFYFHPLIGNENETIIRDSEVDLPHAQTKTSDESHCTNHHLHVYMDAAQITVEPGGNLWLTAKLTTECLDPWLGIEVLGNPDLNQSPTSNQGWVQVINGGTIANAETAIRAELNIFRREVQLYTNSVYCSG